MKKLFAVATLLATLMASNIADAKFSDEYKAKYPKRVKVTTEVASSGRKYTRITYKLFSRSIDGIPFKMVFTTSDDIIKFCDLVYGSVTSRPYGFTGFSWGDGKNRHDIGKRFAYTDRWGRDKYFNFISSGINRSELAEMKNAIILSVHGGGSPTKKLLDKSDKHWKEWEEALNAAIELMNERP